MMTRGRRMPSRYSFEGLLLLRGSVCGVHASPTPPPDSQKPAQSVNRSVDRATAAGPASNYYTYAARFVCAAVCVSLGEGG
jgi:hypothetical protein